MIPSRLVERLAEVGVGAAPDPHVFAIAGESPQSEPDPLLPVSINWHLWPRCNYRCKFCFATFKVIADAIARDDALRIPALLASAGTEKLTFAGGEPLLCPYLGDLLHAAKDAGLTTMIVTNGSLIDDGWLDRHVPWIDWIALSVDSASEATEKALGRGTGRHVAKVVEVAQLIRARGVRLKVNTVVTTLNWDEDMSGLIGEMAPERWKVFQALAIEGENVLVSPSLFPSMDQFHSFLQTHRALAPIAEDNDAMTSSYLMMDPLGRMFQNTGGSYTYSDSVLAVGVKGAIEKVGWDGRKFLSRGGKYTWSCEGNAGAP